MKEQDADVDDKYSEMLSSLQLRNILIERASFERDSDVSMGKANINVQKTTSFAIPDDDKTRFRFHEELIVEMALEDSGATLAKLSCTLLLEYSTSVEIDKEMLEMFADKNLSLHSWPYLREFVQSTTARMNIPPVRLHLLLQKAKKQKEDT